MWDIDTMPAPAPETGDPGGMFLIQGKRSIVRLH